MLFRVTCAGVPIGTVELSPPEGLAHGPLHAAPSYAFAQYFAREMADALVGRFFWDARRGDFAEELARRWSGGRLALEDEQGREWHLASVVVLEHAGADGRVRPWVVADFRPDLARVGALLRPLDRADDGRTRPAA